MTVADGNGSARERQSPGRTALLAQIVLLLGMVVREVGREFYTMIAHCKAKIRVAS